MIIVVTMENTDIASVAQTKCGLLQARVWTMSQKCRSYWWPNLIYGHLFLCDNLLCGHEPLPKCPISLLHNYSLLCMRTFICNFCSWLWMVTHCRPTGGSYKISPPQNLLYLIIVPDLAMVRGICLTCHNIQIKPIDITGHLKFTVMRGLTRSHYSWTVAMHFK